MSQMLKLYPPAWRARYGDEMASLLEERPPTARERLDLARGAVDAWLHPSEPSRIPIVAALVGGGLWTVVASAVLVQPAPLDWPGYLLEIVPLATLAAVCQFVAAIGCALRAGEASSRALAAGAGMLVVGYVAWIAMLGGTALGLGAAAALAGAAITWWALERDLDGHGTAWLLAPDRWTPRGLTFDTFVNGTHPLLPWLAFFCTGIVLGRLLTTTWWRPLTLAVGASLFGVATIVAGSVGDSRRAATLASTDPFDRGLLYTASALGTALAAFAVVSWLADRWPRHQLIEALRHAGAMTLTLYLAHIVVYKVVVDQLGWVRPAGLGSALLFAAVFWAIAIVAAAWYHRRFGIGPTEWVYRKLGG